MERSAQRPCRKTGGRHKGQDGLASTIVPARDIIPPVGGTLVFFSSLASPRAAQAVAALAFVQRNSVPSAHMRCMITAIRRATATIARFIPDGERSSCPRP